MTGIQVDYRDRRPIYEQLIANIRSLVLRGLLAPDEQLPSVRALAADLGINPNTIQKAYTELERQGLIYSTPGRGSFVCSDPAALRQGEQADAMAGVERALQSAHACGIARAEVNVLVEKIWRDNHD